MKVTFKTMAMALPLAMLTACGGSGSSSSDSTPSATPSAAETTVAPAAPAPTSTVAADPAATTTTTTTTTTTAAAGTPPASFAVCKVCHSVDAGKNGVGPSLHGIVGSKAGDVPAYAFSPALKASGITWDRAKLDTWLQGPMKMVPGTKMVMAVPDASKRKEIIDYLETLK